MASKKSKPVKILGKHEVNPNIKIKKKPKTVVKTTLENPFALKWPVIEEEVETEILSRLESCCFDLRVPIIKPPWKDIHKLKGAERIQYRQEYKKTALEEFRSDPDAASKYEMAKESRSHLIFGYNAVMRALEQNRLAGLLIKRDVQPSFLAQTFLPGCINKCIPFVPIVGLDDILKREDMLGVKHSVMVLGLKPSVQESSCRFNPLYNSMVKVNPIGTEFSADDYKENGEENPEHMEFIVGHKKENREGNLEHMEVCVGSDNEDIGQPVHDGKRNNKQSTESSNPVDRSNNSKLKAEGMNVSKNKLTPEEISSYHLKRSGKGDRAFVPVSKKPTNLDKSSDLQEDVIVLEPSKETRTLPEKVSRKKTPTNAIPVEFFFDTTGNDVAKAEKGNDVNGKGRTEPKKYTGPSMFEKRALFKLANPSYVSAMTKRVKNNPNRKSNKKMKKQ